MACKKNLLCPVRRPGLHLHGGRVPEVPACILMQPDLMAFGDSCKGKKLLLQATVVLWQSRIKIYVFFCAARGGFRDSSSLG